MTFDDYQKQAATTDSFQVPEDIEAFNPAFIAKILGLVGESGEVAEKFKKIIRDKDGIISEPDKAEIVKELGDVLWYLAVIAKYLDTNLDQVAMTNLTKLADRQSRNVIQSSGDNR